MMKAGGTFGAGVEPPATGLRAPRAPAHASTSEEVLRALASVPDSGLEEAEVERRRKVHGTNELARAAPTPSWTRFLLQFRSVVVLVLIAAATISLALGETLDALAICTIIVLNGALGFLQEERAARAIEALAELAHPRARVLRQGRERFVPARELVPGDVIRIEAGDAVPADARLIESSSLRTQEAALTGESTPVDKDALVVLEASAPLAERRNSIHFGTTAVAGYTSAVGCSRGRTRASGTCAHSPSTPPGSTPSCSRTRTSTTPVSSRSSCATCFAERSTRRGRAATSWASSCATRRISTSRTHGTRTAAGCARESVRSSPSTESRTPSRRSRRSSCIPSTSR
jgi:magnesium-transporting ATPase (P-type)